MYDDPDRESGRVCRRTIRKSQKLKDVVGLVEESKGLDELGKGPRLLLQISVEWFPTL